MLQAIRYQLLSSIRVLAFYRGSNPSIRNVISVNMLNKILNNRLGSLTFTPRWSGFQYIKQESVSDHVWGMTALALEIVPMLNKLGKGDLDLKDIIFRIQVHDLDECLSCDIPRPFKYHDPALKNAIENTTKALMKEHFDEELFVKICHSKCKRVPEGAFVGFLDSLQAFLYMTNEINLGNSLFRSERNNGLRVLLTWSDFYKNNPFGDDFKEIDLKLVEIIQDLSNI